MRALLAVLCLVVAFLPLGSRGWVPVSLVIITVGVVLLASRQGLVVRNVVVVAGLLLALTPAALLLAEPWESLALLLLLVAPAALGFMGVEGRELRRAAPYAAALPFLLLLRTFIYDMDTAQARMEGLVYATAAALVVIGAFLAASWRPARAHPA